MNLRLSIFWKLLAAPLVRTISVSSKPVTYSLNVAVIGIGFVFVGLVSVDVIPTVGWVKSITNSPLVLSTPILFALSVAVTTTS